MRRKAIGAVFTDYLAAENLFSGNFLIFQFFEQDKINPWADITEVHKAATAYGGNMNEYFIREDELEISEIGGRRCRNGNIKK